MEKENGRISGSAMSNFDIFRPPYAPEPDMGRTSLRARQGYHKPRQDAFGRFEGDPDYRKEEETYWKARALSAESALRKYLLSAMSAGPGIARAHFSNFPETKNG